MQQLKYILRCLVAGEILPRHKRSVLYMRFGDAVKFRFRLKRIAVNSFKDSYHDAA